MTALDESGASDAEYLDQLDREIGSISRVGPKLIDPDDYLDTSPATNLVEVLYGAPPPAPPCRLVRVDGRALIYEGQSHDLFGVPGCGKTLLANMIGKLELDAGGSVLNLDWEMQRPIVDERYLALGADPGVLADRTRFRYYRPAGPLTEVEHAQLAALREEFRPTLLHLDGIGAALAADGADENRNTEFLAWHQRVIVPFLDAGTTVIWTDHRSRTANTNSPGARGAGAKLGAITGASYEVRTVTPFSRDKAGAVKLVIAKDRHGHVGSPGETAAVVTVTPGDGGRVDVTICPPGDPTLTPGAGAGFMPTRLMEKVSRYIEQHDGATRTELRGAKLGKTDYVVLALGHLIDLGHVGESSGPRGAKCHSILDPYREPRPDDPAPDPDPADPGQGADDPDPPPPPSTEGEGRGRGQAGPT